MSLQFTHHLRRCVEGWHGENRLFRYVYHDSAEPGLSPKPHFDELRTPAGRVVTADRPHDHLWHRGLAMACTFLNGDNFWGGPSYDRTAKTYVSRDNHGRMEHRGWKTIPEKENENVWLEQVAWVSHGGADWILEERRIEADLGGLEKGFWRLKLEFLWKNVHSEPLRFGSPTTEGRELAGYGGLFWRGPRSFDGGRILSAAGDSPEKIMGQPSPWCAFTGAHDGEGGESTLIFRDAPANRRHPNKWFVRANPYAVVGISPMFDEYYILPPGDEILQCYDVTIADGAWTRGQIEEFVKK